MKTGIEGINLIKKFESLHDGDLSMIGLQPKMDPIGIWTSGYGRALRDSNGNFIKGAANKDLAYKIDKIHTVEDAEKALMEDLTPFELAVSRAIKLTLNQNQFDALVSYWYNTGGSESLAKLINKVAPVDDIKKWFTTKYITADGKKLKGLVLRRQAECDLFFKK